MNMEGTLDIVTEQGEITIETASYHAYRGAVMAFEDAVAAGREPSPSGLDGLRSVALTSAIAESLRDGRAIAVTA
jgi:predicted dehydrogenase